MKTFGLLKLQIIIFEIFMLLNIYYTKNTLFVYVDV